MSLQNHRKSPDAVVTDLSVIGLLPLAEQLRQLSNIHSDAPRLIERQHLSDVGFGACIASVDVDEAWPDASSTLKPPGICSTRQGDGKRR